MLSKEDWSSWTEERIREECVVGTKAQAEAYKNAGYLVSGEPRRQVVRSYPFKIVFNKWPKSCIAPPANDTADAIARGVCKRHRLTKDQLFGSCREPRFVLARREAYYLCHVKLGMSKVSIGRFFKKDHSTVLYHIKAVNNSTAKKALDAMIELL